MLYQVLEVLALNDGGIWFATMEAQMVAAQTRSKAMGIQGFNESFSLPYFSTPHNTQYAHTS